MLITFLSGHRLSARPLDLATHQHLAPFRKEPAAIAFEARLRATLP
ncbi:hypothetical protein [Streptomyces sp. NPDC053427]